MEENNKENQDCKLIVLTGGPGAGKTALLEALKKQLCSHVVILPESASIIYGGGFWRLNSVSARVAAQKAIFHVQQEMENLVVAEKEWTIGLCDRGTLDGLAYWPKEESSFFKTFQTTKEREYEKYEAVIHLKVPEDGNGYNHQNPLRIESAERARRIDERIHKVWRDHKNYSVIDSQEDFIDKMKIASEKLSFFVHPCCGHHLSQMT